MDHKNIESTLKATNHNLIDVIPSFSNYKFGNHMQHSSQLAQHYQKSHTIQTDYPIFNGVGIDVNNNYGSTYGAALSYYNDASIIANINSNNTNNSSTNISNNNNSISFQNQNFKIQSKYVTNGNQYPPSQYGGVNTINGASIANATACQYAHTYGGSSCYNRNRYMPYNHNRACAAAAAMGVGVSTTSNPFCSSSKISTAISNAGNNIAIMPPLLYSSYQQFATTYPNIIPLMSQPTNMTVPHIGLEPANTYFMTAYDRNIPSAQVDCSRHPLNLHSNFIQPHRATIESDAVSACSSTLKPLVHSSMPYTTAPCTTVTTAAATVSSTTSNSTYASVTDLSQAVSLRLTNLDYTMDEESLRKFLMAQLKPITPVVSLTFEDSNFATVTVPDSYFAKQVVANLHRKKIGHKRIIVSYTRDSSLTEANTLRCQVAGLLKDVPYNRLPLYKFRELFQTRFKTSISVLDLYTMRDICTINSDSNEEKFITLLPNLVNSLENSPLMEGLQHTVPYCKEHFKREQHKGWAEQEIEPLPNVFMTLKEIQNILNPLLKSHHGDIPISSLVHCIEGQLNIKIEANDNGVNLEHLVCCIQGIKIQTNNFGIKILSWQSEVDRRNSSGNNTAGSSCNSSASERGLYFKSADPLSQITREVIELVKISPKSTMKFSRFIPAYHNHFGKQCRVADYGYTKLIELFEALSSVVQIMGDGENRQITLTHRTQIRRFTSDLFRLLRSSGNKAISLSELPQQFAQSQNRIFDITSYGICNIRDILDDLVYSNVVVVAKVPNSEGLLISFPKRPQSCGEIAKTCIFAGEMVELFQNAPQYTVLFQKFVRSYHYHFAYQCRLSDYGFSKLADLMEAIHGVVEMDRTNDEDRRIFLSPLIARRVFAEQSEELIRVETGSSKTPLKLKEVLKLHKKKYGYQILAETLGVEKLEKAAELLPYVEVFEENGEAWITCHNHDPIFRTLCYRACKHLLAYDPHKYRSGVPEKTQANTTLNPEQKRKPPRLNDFIIEFNAKYKENLNINMVKAMQYVIQIFTDDTNRCVRITEFMSFVINIVRLLEQRTVLLLSEIKSNMNCSIKATFAFGYPNLFTLLTAYPDIFIVNMSVTQESSEVRLAPNCELITQRNLSNNVKVTKTPMNATKQLARPALAEFNGRNSNANYDGPPLAKIRNIMSTDDANTTLNDLKIWNFNNYLYQQPSLDINSTIALQNRPKAQFLSTNYSFCSDASNIATLHNSTISNSSFSSDLTGASNKENSFHGSFNNSLNSSNNSFLDLNASLMSHNSMHLSSTINSNCNTSKLWERRQDTKIHFRQPSTTTLQPKNAQNVEVIRTALPPLVIPAKCTNSKTLDVPLISQRSLYNIMSSIQNGPPGTPLCSPPKPDSPPNHNLPFWIDPIWSQSLKGQKKTELMHTNIKHLDGQAPMILSPYTLSKIVNINKTLNFESPDRKIA